MLYGIFSATGIKGIAVGKKNFAAKVIITRKTTFTKVNSAKYCLE